MKTLKFWLHGLSAAAIGGAATAVTTFLVQDAAHADLRSVGKAALVGGLLTAASYLKQSPLPPGKS